MKDRIGRAKFINLPVKNPTQTRYTRFMRMPYTRLESAFTRSEDKYRTLMNNALKNRYSEYLED